MADLDQVPDRSPVDDLVPPGDDRSGGYALAGIVTFAAAWFAVSWLVMGSPPADAVGEAAGGVVVVLVLVSVVGAVRHSRRG